MTDNNGYVLAPLPVAPVNETDIVLLPKGLTALQQLAKEAGWACEALMAISTTALTPERIASAFSMRG
jgi:hypothetical protein